MGIEQAARESLEACGRGGGWDACKSHSRDAAGFARQGDALAATTTPEGCADRIKALSGLVPDGRYEIAASAADGARGTGLARAAFHGARTGAGGAGEPTARPVASDRAHVMAFDRDRIAHMTRIWDDAQAARQPGRA